ncbi:unnamed protein product [Rhizophagus irregularis]|nr:unnamed protein product [Rhizophagus irregularis]
MWKFSQLSAKIIKENKMDEITLNCLIVPIGKLMNIPCVKDSDELLAINDIGDYWPTSPPKKHIHVIVKLPLLSLEEALSC